MFKYPFAVILVATFFLLAATCSERKHYDFANSFFSKDSTQHLLNVSPYFISNSFNNWSIKFIGAYDIDSLSIRFFKIENDTIKNLTFAVDKFEDANPFYIIVYEKQYKIGNRIFLTNYSSKDTLYSYSSIQNSDEKVFIRGGYFYKGSHAGLATNEQRYYRLYRDSLDKIRGNYLPTLPELSPEEMKKFVEMFEQND